MTNPADRTATVAVTRPRGSNERRAVGVVVVSGADAGLRIAPKAGPLIVGRTERADVRLADPAVSQFHVEIDATDDGVRVRDLGSHNGTWADAIAIDRAVVPSHTRLRIGETTIEVEVGEACTVERSKASSFGGLVGASPPMREVYSQLDRLASARLAILLEGDTGTGKALAARALHERANPGAPFVAVQCSALLAEMGTLLFFGKSGETVQPSVFELARGGTVFLDEIADLPPALQVKLLGALGRVTDVRVVSSSSRPLRPLVNRGSFREELYFRIAEARVRLPSLQERPDDVKPLVQHFLETMPWESAGARAIAPDALDAIAARELRGNVRELRSIVQRAATLAAGPTITLEDLAFERALDRDAEEPAPASTPLEPFKEAKRTVVDEFERAYLARLLARTGKNVSRAAALAGIERQSLRDLLKRHGLRGEHEE